MASSPIARELLHWYDANARVLPWRTPPGSAARADPYRVWVSEVMLQQTGVKVVAPRFERFTARWPDIRALAAAEADEVMGEWAGLGYYSRARNLHACARTVVETNGGELPGSYAKLRTLPGLGDYTAAAVGAIAFGEPVPVVDGNVERVVSRLVALERPPKRAKAEVRETVRSWTPTERPGDFAQAMMDLGATICTPRAPACLHCPVRSHCVAQQRGEPTAYPRKEPRKQRPSRRGAAFVARRPDGAVLVTRRPPSGLLGGTACVPTNGWSSRADAPVDASDAPFPAPWTECGEARHGFTHFDLALTVWAAETERAAPPGHWWSADIAAEGATTLLRRILDVASPVADPTSR